MNFFLPRLVLKIFLTFTFLGNILMASDFWDPQAYSEVSTMQKRWIKNLLNQIELANYNHLLDVGCGDGGITAELALNNKSVVGIDISEKMISFAKNKYSNIDFFVKDAEEINFSKEFDAVVSFNTLHRLKNPEKAISLIQKSLKPQGIFIAVLPAIGSKILSSSIAEVDTRDKWNNYLPVKDRKNYKNTEEDYKKYLENAGFIIKKVKIIWETEQFKNKQAFCNLLKETYSKKDCIPIEEQDNFFNQIIEEYLSFMPEDHEGKVHFYFNRMEIIAQNP